MLGDLPPARVRAEVDVPLALVDGSVAIARVLTFDGLVDDREHLAIGLGCRTPSPLVRVHSECLTGDVLGSRRCDCGPQLADALVRVRATGGYVLYLRQEGRGIGLYEKLDAYLLQDLGLDTYEANVALGHLPDERDYTVAAQMLAALEVRSVNLLSNNPDKVRQLRRLGVTVTAAVPTAVHVNTTNQRYLRAKATRGNHSLDVTTDQR
jgi:GTP cyclohydrolase II